MNAIYCIFLLLIIAGSSATKAAVPDCDGQASDEIFRALREKEELVSYVCPNGEVGCSLAEFSSRMRLERIVLGPTSGLTAHLCAFVATPDIKGRQFPTFIVESTDPGVRLLAEDWETGLKLVPSVVRHGYYVLEGRSLPSPERVDVYRLERINNRYREFRRKCFLTSGLPDNRLIAVKCDRS